MITCLLGLGSTNDWTSESKLSLPTISFEVWPAMLIIYFSDMNTSMHSANNAITCVWSVQDTLKLTLNLAYLFCTKFWFTLIVADDYYQSLHTLLRYLQIQGTLGQFRKTMICA